jgi:nitronate monooxygenase
VNPHNTFITRLKGKESIILPYPVQNILTRLMRNAAAKKGESGFQSLWAGQGVTRSRSMPQENLFRNWWKKAGVAFA